MRADVDTRSTRTTLTRRARSRVLRRRAGRGPLALGGPGGRIQALGAMTAEDGNRPLVGDGLGHGAPAIEDARPDAERSHRRVSTPTRPTVSTPWRSSRRAQAASATAGSIRSTTTRSIPPSARWTISPGSCTRRTRADAHRRLPQPWLRPRAVSRLPAGLRRRARGPGHGGDADVRLEREPARTSWTAAGALLPERRPRRTGAGASGRSATSGSSGKASRAATRCRSSTGATRAGRRKRGGSWRSGGARASTASSSTPSTGTSTATGRSLAAP